MSRDESRTAFGRRLIRTFPTDLAVAVLLTLLTGTVVLTPGITGTNLRLVFGIPFLLFLPGYVLVSVLFPRAEGAETESSAASRTATGISGFERVSLSVGTSVAVNSMLGFLLNFTPWGIRLLPILVAIYLFTVVTAVVAAVRRLRTPPADRFAVPFGYWFDKIRWGLFRPETRVDAVLNALLVVSLILAVGSVAYAIGFPHQQDSFTQFYVLASDESGEPATDGYPKHVAVGENVSLYVGIENHEHRHVNYTVVVLLQRFYDNSTRVRSADRLDRFRVSLGSNETTLAKRSVSPTMRGDRLRLAYVLYKGTPPSDSAPSNAYRTAYVWVNASKEGISTSIPAMSTQALTLALLLSAS